MKRIFFLMISLLFIGSGAMAWESRMLVRIYLDTPERITVLEDMHLDFASHAITDHADVVVTASELAEIQRRGFQPEIIQYEEDVRVPPEYHTVDETWAVLDSLHQLYPTITELDTCGFSQRFGLPIPLFTISQNVGTRQDEPAALITGMHHAREPIGNEICLFTIKKILEDYPDSAYAERFVDSMELQFVPIVNPEGWKYITDSSLTGPLWWRKNLRDNGNNGGPINPDSDGVDVNRNYDWRWTEGGSTDPTSWVYRGPYPTSESEIQALVNLSTERKFVVGISYHSYGYAVFYPWVYGTQYPPDITTLTRIAQNMALEIGYSAQPLNGTNMSSNWFYGQLGMYDFLIETARSFIPPAESILIETEKNFRGETCLLNRCFYSGITGHVRDSLTLQPIEATVEVTDLSGDSIVPRTSDSLFGRFYRLLDEGTYTLCFSKPGYTTKTISDISVTSDSLTKVEVLLVSAPGVESGDIVEHFDSPFGVWPNPFRDRTDIRFQITDNSQVNLRIYNATGRLVKDFRLTPSALRSTQISWDGTDQANRQLPSGVYFLKLEAGDYSATEKLLLIR